MPTMPNTPVLIGPVPLGTVTSLTLNEGYQVARIAGSPLAQLVSPTTTSIAVEATLVGPERGRVKQALEAMALTTRALASATAPLMAVAGVPVVSGLTIHLDMQITSLRFSQSAERRDAIQASVTLEHVPRSSIAELLGEALDLDLAAGFSAVPSAAQAAAIPRALGAPV
jgi:hypothetical protein